MDGVVLRGLGSRVGGKEERGVESKKGRRERRNGGRGFSDVKERGRRKKRTREQKSEKIGNCETKDFKGKGKLGRRKKGERKERLVMQRRGKGRHRGEGRSRAQR